MSFIRTKTITKNGRSYSYRYRQTNVRVGKKVRSKMEYLGRASTSSFGGMSADDRQARALATAERMAAEIDAHQRAAFGETGEERTARETKENQFDQGKFLEETHAAPEKADTTGKGESGGL